MNDSLRPIRYIGDRWFPLVLVILSVWDLRTEFRLLLENFTYTAVVYAVRHHSLALITLIGSPSLFRRYSVFRSLKY